MKRSNKARWWAYKNSLEHVNRDAFAAFAKSNWNGGYLPEATLTKTEGGGYVLEFDGIPVVEFNSNITCGLHYSSMEKRYVDNVYDYACEMIVCLAADLRPIGQEITGDRHFQANDLLMDVEDYLAEALDRDYQIRPEVTESRIELQDDGSYFCTCKLNGFSMDTHYKDGAFVKTTFEECCYDLEELEAELSDTQLSILKKHFHFAMFALNWRLKRVLERK